MNTDAHQKLYGHACPCERCVERRRKLLLIRKHDLDLDAITWRFGVSRGEAVRLRREAKA